MNRELRAETDGVVPRTLWRLFAVIWLAFLIFPIRDLLIPQGVSFQLVPVLIGLASLITGYLWLMLRDPFPVVIRSAAALRRRQLVIMLIAGIVVALTLISGLDWLWFFMYASMPAGVQLPARLAVPAIVGLTLVELVAGAATAGWLIAGRIALPVMAVGLGMIGVARLVDTVRELRAARTELARLAVAEERVRFARDLHDLLGHSLSAITLKLELARRLIPTEPAQAEREVVETIAAARTALQEVREAVAGYRRPTLATELQAAEALLTSAGIAAHCGSDGAVVTPAAEAVLAWAVREGATNVVRHGQARSCAIHVIHDATAVAVEVLDDGLDGTDSAASSPDGNGLRGLAERAAPLGGHVEAGPVAGGFRLRVVLPLDAQRELGP